MSRLRKTGLLSERSVLVVLLNHCASYYRSACARALQTAPEHQQEGRSNGAVSGRLGLSYVGVCWCICAVVVPALRRS